MMRSSLRTLSAALMVATVPCVALVFAGLAIAADEGKAQPPDNAPRLSASLNEAAALETHQGWPMVLVAYLQAPGAELDTPIEALTLAVPTGTWADLLRIEVVDAQGQAASWPFRPAYTPPSSIKLDGEHDGEMAWYLLESETATLAPGAYTLTAVLDTAECGAPESWKGLARSSPVEVRLVPEPKPLTPEMETQKQLLRINTDLWRGEAAGALAGAEAMLAAHGDSYQALMGKGDALRQLGRNAEAIASYQQALAEFQHQKPRAQEPPAALMARLREAGTAVRPTVSAAAAPPALATPPAPATPGAAPNVPGTEAMRATNALEADRQRQWPIAARASSQYGPTSNSAQQALGPPDTLKYGDAHTAWTPASENGGLEWLEVGYPFSVIPTAIEVYESSGAGAITKVMVRPEGDQAEWVTVLEQAAPGDHAGDTKAVVTTVDAGKVGKATRAVRVELDTAVPGWNEIDTVALVGKYLVGAGDGLSTGAYRWWAESAKASSQYGDPGNSPGQATGMPDTQSGRDQPTAWAPKVRDGGPEWLEVSYPRAVAATELRIHESYGPGFVTKIESWDEQAGRWTIVWEGQDPTKTPGVFSPPLTALPPTARTFRIHVNTAVPDWNEIDAVELVGN